MSKTAPRELIKRIKDKEKTDRKSNYTFRLSDELMQRLKKVCAENEVSMASVIEELLKEFVSGK